VWQKLYEELKDQNFMIITVAMDSRGESAVRGPITRAKTSYVSLVDRDHRVAELYNMVNVPQAVWIDEAGRNVRPTETAGAAMSLNIKKIRPTRAI
jgi:alkyl hydroperoxide reductase subunit AhpC